MHSLLTSSLGIDIIACIRDASNVFLGVALNDRLLLPSNIGWVGGGGGGGVGVH